MTSRAAMNFRRHASLVVVVAQHGRAKERTGLPDAELAVVPGTSHGLLVEKPALCNLLITEFLTKEPVETYAPIRRAARQAP